MTGPYPPQQPDPAHYGPPPGTPPQFPDQVPPQFPPQFTQRFAPRPGRPPRDRMVIALIAIIATLLVLCLAMAVGSVYFLREEPGDDKTSEVVDHRPAGG
ncbi:hypothetical protein OHA72_61145 [Dactylosporangium sp. NBC_01737]|uniref:hypothetical protein n=1 Tax=Dactylosporangium sp. NBC_01737 TaxID=2975959 RepID=UPI002E15DD29|nr:hypothetical protein OHA72_61145 [Dactylosporangium sp. NBC_01737]